MKKNQKISIETMTGMGKKKTIAGREYMILPVNIKDMCYVMGESEDTPKLFIIDSKKIETDD